MGRFSGVYFCCLEVLNRATQAFLTGAEIRQASYTTLLPPTAQTTYINNTIKQYSPLHASPPSQQLAISDYFPVIAVFFNKSWDLIAD